MGKIPCSVGYVSPPFVPALTMALLPATGERIRAPAASDADAGRAGACARHGGGGDGRRGGGGCWGGAEYDPLAGSAHAPGSGLARVWARRLNALSGRGEAIGG